MLLQSDGRAAPLQERSDEKHLGMKTLFLFINWLAVVFEGSARGLTTDMFEAAANGPLNGAFYVFTF
jgi:hypothetical protein